MLSTGCPVADVTLIYSPAEAPKDSERAWRERNLRDLCSQLLSFPVTMEALDGTNALDKLIY